MSIFFFKLHPPFQDFNEGSAKRTPQLLKKSLPFCDTRPLKIWNRKKKHSEESNAQCLLPTIQGADDKIRSVFGSGYLGNGLS
jgi:hypothetical protein